MTQREQLLERLNAIGDSLKASEKALALLGLGSVGQELERIDAYSDLDFFAIVQRGAKNDFLYNLDWLERIFPIAYHFQNSIDGYKLLFEDGIFCEFAIFEPHELANIPYPEGRVVWAAEGFDRSTLKPQVPLPQPSSASVEWMLGEALTNLYVGLGRYHRGEKLSAYQFVQSYALNNLFKLAQHIENEQPTRVDPFNIERRFENRFPVTASHLGEFIQGYDRTPESARAILAFLEAHFEVNAAIKAEILRLCEAQDNV